MAYNYPKTKEELTKLFIELPFPSTSLFSNKNTELMKNETIDPNPLTFRQKEAFKEWLFNSYKIYPTEEDILKFKQFFIGCEYVEVYQDPDEKGLVYKSFTGKISRFNKYNSEVIKVLRELDPEIKIRMMAIAEEDMEIYISEARKEMAKEFTDFFKEKRYENKETGEFPEWDLLLTDFHEDYDLKKPITMKKLISEIKTGKMKLEQADKLFKQMKEEVLLREEED